MADIRLKQAEYWEDYRASIYWNVYLALHHYTLEQEITDTFLRYRVLLWNYAIHGYKNHKLKMSTEPNVLDFKKIIYFSCTFVFEIIIVVLGAKGGLFSKRIMNNKWKIGI